MVSILNEYGEDFLKKVVDFSPEKKLMLGLIYINRQKNLVLLFDKIYHTKLHDFFCDYIPVSFTHLRAPGTQRYFFCRLLLEKKKTKSYNTS